MRSATARTSRTRLLTGAVVVSSLAALLGACSDGSHPAKASKSLVTITCATCTASPSDPFSTYNGEEVAAFNTKYAGQYQVKIVKNQYSSPSADRLQYYQRLALANDLPDLFIVSKQEGVTLEQTGKLMDFGPALKADAAWQSSFYPGALAPLVSGGKTWGIPEQRDAIGMYYNKALFTAAGVTSFPQTWDELATDCALIKKSGKTCLAMDGDWVTLLMWANLIGTQPGGADFLTKGITSAGWADNPVVVSATETLKSWHTAGYVNRDAFSGDYQNAATPFREGEAAIIANGPWMVNTDIKAKNAVKGLYANTGYEASPGWTSGRGMLVVAGSAGWVSGAATPDKQQAVTAFMKFVTSRDASLELIRKTGSYPPVQIKLTDSEKSSLEPLAANVVEQSGTVPLIYPHAYVNGPAALGQAWKNLWPAYVKGQMDTKSFLLQLATDATKPVG